MGARVLVIDNYDSFVYNLVQYLGELGAEPIVHRSDAMDLAGLRAESPDAVLISPGPGTPAEAGLSNEVIRSFAGEVPVLGVCLGHQCIGEVFGATVVRAPEVMHGKTSAVSHSEDSVLVGLPSPFTATRYHSLAVEPPTVPEELVVTCSTANGIIMGLRHKTLPLHGVQFHPESVLTQGGHRLLANWLEVCGMPDAEARSAGLSRLVSGR